MDTGCWHWHTSMDEALNLILKKRLLIIKKEQNLENITARTVLHVTLCVARELLKTEVQHSSFLKNLHYREINWLNFHYVNAMKMDMVQK